ncbi:MAG: PDZ domain-containing protein [Acidobacteriota bacterium]|nr:PDZ domain-containing protein [Acidobacteriota bacterium]
MNVLLAIVLWWGILVYGDVELDIPQGPPVVEEVRPDSPAAAAGIQPGDRILALGDTRLESYARTARKCFSVRGRRWST